MTACQKCGQPATSALKHLGPFCTPCYCSMLERRVRRDLREAKPYAPRGKAHLVTDGTLESAVSERIIASIITQPTTLTTGPAPTPGAAVLLPFALEDDAEDTLTEWLLPSGARQARPHGFALLRTLTREEIAEFARLQGIPGTPRAPAAIGKLFEDLARDHPEIKFGLQRSRRALDTVLASDDEDA